MAVVTTILHAANRHALLTSERERAEAASRALGEVKEEITKLEDEAEVRVAQLSSAKAKTSSLRNERSVLEDSTRTKLAYKLSGKSEKLEEMARTLEQSFLEAVSAEQAANSEYQFALQRLAESRDAHDLLVRHTEELPRIHSELYDLYESIFSGPTPEYPEEDAVEDKLGLASVSFADFSARLPIERRVSKLLSLALTKMDLVMKEMEDVTLISETQPYRELRIEKIRRALVETQTCIVQAHMAQPSLSVLEDIAIPDVSWADTIPKNFSTEQSFAKRDHVRSRYKVVWKKIKSHIVAQANWVRSVQSGMETAEKEVKEAKEELFLVRKSIFERVIQTGGDLPPDYEA